VNDIVDKDYPNLYTLFSVLQQKFTMNCLIRLNNLFCDNLLIANCTAKSR
jgi:hypothetical protein